MNSDILDLSGKDKNDIAVSKINSDTTRDTLMTLAQKSSDVVFEPPQVPKQ